MITLDDFFALGAQGIVLRHEDEADTVFAGIGQRRPGLRHFLGEEGVRDLDQHAGTVAHQRVGADRTAVGQVLEHLQAVGNDLVGLLALHVGDKADTAGIVFARRIVEPFVGGRAQSFGKSSGGGRRRHTSPPACMAVLVVSSRLVMCALTVNPSAAVARSVRFRSGRIPSRMRLGEPWLTLPRLCCCINRSGSRQNKPPH